MIEGQAITPAIDRFAFRGQFLDSFAQIEHHLAVAVERAVELGLAKRAPHLFGQKFDLIRKTVTTEGLWEHPEHIQPIIEDLSELAELRGLIGHSIIENAMLHSGPALSIEAPGVSVWKDRRVLTLKECQTMLDVLATLTKRLHKQRIKPQPSRTKAPPNPPAPLDPASATHPASGTSAPSRS